MNRGLFGGFGTLIGRLAAVETIAADADAKSSAAAAAANTAAGAATAANGAASSAASAASALETAVATGNKTHDDLYQKLDGKISAVAIGTGRLPVALLLNASTDVTVPLSRAMPTAAYKADVAPTAGMGFTVRSKTATDCVITVKASLALAVGATFTVIAYQ